MSRAGPGIPESSSSGVSVGTDDGLSSGTGAVAVSVDPPHHTSAAGLTPSQTPPGPSLPDSVQPEDGLQGLTLEPRQQPKQQEQLRAGAVVAGHQPSGKTAKQGSGLPQPQPSLTAAAQPPHRNGSLEAQGRKLPASFDPSTCRTLCVPTPSLHLAGRLGQMFRGATLSDGCLPSQPVSRRACPPPPLRRETSRPETAPAGDLCPLVYRSHEPPVEVSRYALRLRVPFT